MPIYVGLPDKFSFESGTNKGALEEVESVFP